MFVEFGEPCFMWSSRGGSQKRKKIATITTNTHNIAVFVIAITLSLSSQSRCLCHRNHAILPRNNKERAPLNNF